MMFGENDYAGTKLMYYSIIDSEWLWDWLVWIHEGLVARVDLYIHGWASRREMSHWFAATLNNTGDWISIMADINACRPRARTSFRISIHLQYMNIILGD